MCGIFAYYGEKKNAPQIVIEGLKNLEYRGYDSWGLAYKTADEIVIQKEIGKIGEVKIKDLDLGESGLAMAHSRWATHGGVTKANAHPHFSEKKEIVLIHNGIFENYAEVKKNLIKKGHKFVSQTDTEVLAHLIENHARKHSFEDSVKLAVKEIEGRYAILVMKKDEDKIIAARKGSPLIIGVGKTPGEYFIASDIPAFLKYTKKVIYLDDNQLCVIAKKKINFYDTGNNKEIKKRIIEIDWNLESAEKGEFAHFMLKEIMEQKDTLNRAINQDPKTIEQVAKAIENAESTYFVGCGTAGKVAMVGSYLFAKISKKQVRFVFGSEFPNYKDFI
ncbi:class II glutamine amidotransferase, partial [Candidatus Peregrinibacteria bacterium]|nr:class II glutamine amidotransferase [Candidatus Peregrinibacteria bacterium]